MDKSFSVTAAKSIYILLTSLFLLTFGIFTAVVQSYEIQWIKVGFATSVLLLVFLVATEIPRANPYKINLWVIACLVYCALVLLEGSLHHFALRQIPELNRVNVAVLTAKAWLHQNGKFTALYLYTPILCLLQYMLFRRLNLTSIQRIIALGAGISFVLVIIPYLDQQILKDGYYMGGQRFRGLSTAPNSLALTAHLLLPWFVTGLLFANRRLEKILYAVLIILLAKGVMDSGSRTGSVLFLAFLAFVPLALVAAQKHRNKRNKFVLPAIPIVLLLGLLALSALLDTDMISQSGVLGRRLLQAEARLENEGVLGIFFRQEARGLYALLAWVLLTRAPLSGWGPGGFYREFPNALFLSRGEIKPTTDSALNHYLMIGGDLGYPGLLLNLLLILTPLILGCFVLKRLTEHKERLIVTLLLFNNFLFLVGINIMPPSYFPDVMWIWTGQLAYLVVLAERHGMFVVAITKRRGVLFLLLTSAILSAVAVGAREVTFGSAGYAARHHADWWPWRYGKNCYEAENWKEGVGCWCGNEAVLQVPFFDIPPDTVHLQIVAYHPDIHMNPVTVKYGGVAGTTERIVLSDHSWETITIPVTDEYLYSPTASSECKRWDLPRIPGTERFRMIAPTERRQIWYFVVTLRVSRTWVPKGGKEGQAVRELGLGVLLPEGKLSRNCFSVEEWQEGRGRWCGDDAILQIPITRSLPDTVKFQIGAYHPDVLDNPVIVRYGGISRFTGQVILDDFTWTTVSVPVTQEYLYSTTIDRGGLWWHLVSIPKAKTFSSSAEELEQKYFVISLDVSRTWIPSEWGKRDDHRELGLAVLLPEL